MLSEEDSTSSTCTRNCLRKNKSEHRGTTVPFSHMHLGVAEQMAWRASVESGLDDRPRADPAVLAVGYLSLRLAPVEGAKAHLVGNVIVYPAEASAQTRAYMIGHEGAHALIRMERMRVSAAIEEEMASRIACAWLLPRSPFLRDVASGASVAALVKFWPLATPVIVRRRMHELGC